MARMRIRPIPAPSAWAAESSALALFEKGEYAKAIDTAAAEWAIDHYELAGRGSGTLAASEWLFQPLLSSGEALGPAGERAAAVDPQTEEKIGAWFQPEVDLRTPGQASGPPLGWIEPTAAETVAAFSGESGTTSSV